MLETIPGPSISPRRQLAQGLSCRPLRKQISHLIDVYFSEQILWQRLQELPQQFSHPEPRPWPQIDWQGVHPDQIVDIELPVFLSILQGAIDTEAPIRDYSQTSRRYLEPLHPAMARYVGGEVGPEGKLLAVGLWEKEERRHTPALLKIYRQLSGAAILPTGRQVRAYTPGSDPCSDLYSHGFHRIATEYGAACLYLWLMAHCTGPLEAVLAELTRDEVNHMTTFWGFGTWFFPESSLWKVMGKVFQPSAQPSHLLRTLKRMAGVLAWSDWSLTNKFSFGFTCIQVLYRLWHWQRSLTPKNLEAVLGAIAK